MVFMAMANKQQICIGGERDLLLATQTKNVAYMTEKCMRKMINASMQVTGVWELSYEHVVQQTVEIESEKKLK